jgi:hypothetical protein
MHNATGRIDPFRSPEQTGGTNGAHIGARCRQPIRPGLPNFNPKKKLQHSRQTTSEKSQDLSQVRYEKQDPPQKRRAAAAVARELEAERERNSEARLNFFVPRGRGARGNPKMHDIVVSIEFILGSLCLPMEHGPWVERG